MDEVKKTPLSGHERKALQHTLAFYSQAGLHGDALQERLRQYPNGWRDWCLMISLASKAIERLYQTLTDSQYNQMRKLEQFGECAVHVKTAAKGEDFDFVHMTALKTVIGNCIDATCSLCVKNDAETRGCKLRKALYDIAPPMEIPRFGCAYRDLVHQEGWKEDM